MPTEDLASDSVPGYRLLRVIGRGGMGIVYEAHADAQGGDTLAIKVIRSEWADDPEYRRLFAQEAQQARRVVHPNVIEVLDHGESDGHPYIVMRYVDGNTLKYFVDHVGRMSLAKATDIIAHVADALDAVHRAGLVHGDVSPANVMLTRSSRGVSRPLLTDFGLARPLSAVSLSASDTWARSGQGIGTPGFIAPEKIAGDRLTHHADIYSLCALLHFLLLGEPPHAGMTPLRQQRDDLPAALDEVMARALRTVPYERYDTAGEFAHALRQAAHRGRRRRPLIAVAAALAIAISAAGLAYVLTPPDSGTRRQAAAISPAPYRPAPSAPATTSVHPVRNTPRTHRPAHPRSPSPSTSMRSTAAVSSARRVVCAKDLYIRESDNSLTGDKLYRGDVITVHRHNSSGTLSQFTSADGRTGWVETIWLRPTLNDCPS